MLKIILPFATATALASTLALPAMAADIYYDPPPAYEAPAPKVVYKDVSFGGWYIRGDIDYHMPRWGGADYILYSNPPGTGTFDTGKLRGAFSVGGGVGYQINPHLRTDLTADYWFKSSFEGSTSGICAGGVPCTSVDTSSFSALLLLANAYAELGTYKRITPYIGAGIGGAYVKWDNLRNQIEQDGIDDLHRGARGMRFAWALMAGASYCITGNLHADLGYRFSRISGGRMFEETTPEGVSIGAGPGFHRAINTHEVRAGLRYQFGAPNKGCVDKPRKVEHVTYKPEPIWDPVYKK